MTGRGTGGPVRRPPDTGKRAPAATGCVEGFRGDTLDAAAWLGRPRRGGGQRVVRRRGCVEEQVRPAGARPGSLRRIGRRPGLLVPGPRHEVPDVVCGVVCDVVCDAVPGVVVSGAEYAVVAGVVPGRTDAVMPCAMPGPMGLRNGRRRCGGRRSGGRRSGGSGDGGREAPGGQGGGHRPVRRGGTADQGEDGEEQRGQHAPHPVRVRPGLSPVRRHLGWPDRSGGVGRWRSTELRICPAPRTTVVDGSSARRTRVPRQRAR
ncbi:hypothetical protein A3Q37_00468 [Streptomyces sp. PTY087I2]|nr:hypothetical protein A3Q37_00468 [Streptomyces sp. PTY087I2]